MAVVPFNVLVPILLLSYSSSLNAVSNNDHPQQVSPGGHEPESHSSRSSHDNNNGNDGQTLDPRGLHQPSANNNEGNRSHSLLSPSQSQQGYYIWNGWPILNTHQQQSQQDFNYGNRNQPLTSQTLNPQGNNSGNGEQQMNNFQLQNHQGNRWHTSHSYAQAYYHDNGRLTLNTQLHNSQIHQQGNGAQPLNPHPHNPQIHHQGNGAQPLTPQLPNSQGPHQRNGAQPMNSQPPNSQSHHQGNARPTLNSQPHSSQGNGEPLLNSQNPNSQDLQQGYGGQLSNSQPHNPQGSNVRGQPFGLQSPNTQGSYNGGQPLNFHTQNQQSNYQQGHGWKQYYNYQQQKWLWYYQGNGWQPATATQQTSHQGSHYSNGGQTSHHTETQNTRGQHNPDNQNTNGGRSQVPLNTGYTNSVASSHGVQNQGQSNPHVGAGGQHNTGYQNPIGGTAGTQNPGNNHYYREPSPTSVIGIGGPTSSGNNNGNESDIRPRQPTSPTQVYQQSPAAIILQADIMYERGFFNGVVNLLMPKQLEGNIEMLWRTARAMYLVSKTIDADHEFLQIQDANRVIEQALAINSESADVNAWAAALLGEVNERLGDRERLANAPRVKQLAEKALILNPKQVTAHHTLGMWCYKIAEIPDRLKSLAVLAFQMEVPTCDYNQALKHFQDAENAEPGFYNTNLVMLAKTERMRNDYELSLKYVRQAVEAPVVWQMDIKTRKEAEQLLQHWTDEEDKYFNQE